MFQALRVTFLRKLSPRNAFEWIVALGFFSALCVWIHLFWPHPVELSPLPRLTLNEVLEEEGFESSVPIDPSHRWKVVMMYSYMRGGSTYSAQMFKSNPDAELW